MAPFDTGKTLFRGIWPNSQEHYYFFFDYILFTDGTTCGNDNHHRSIQIARYLDSHARAIAQLKVLADGYENGGEIVSALEKAFAGGFNSTDNPGPPNPATVKSMPQSAYEHVVLQLRRMENHKKEALELADKLEKDIPR